MTRLVPAAGAVALLAAATTALTGATFTAHSSNPGSTFTAAATFCTTPRTVTLSAARDSWVDQNAATTAHGSDTTLTVTSRGTRNARALVGFTLPATQGCSVTAAELRLTPTTAAAGRTLAAARVDPATPWTETAVTWSTQPSVTGTAATTASGSTLRTWSVAAQVQAMYAAGETNGSFQVADAAEGATGLGATQAFASRENATTASRPVLVVTFG